MEEGQREDGTRNGGIDPAETRGSRDKGLPCVETLRHHSAIIPPTFFPSNDRITRTGNSFSSFRLPREILPPETFFFVSRINDLPRVRVFANSSAFFS